MEFVDVCARAELAAGTALACRVRGRDVALFDVEGAVHAIENACLHGGSALAGGKVCGHFVSCPAHGLRFDVTTGALAGSQGKAGVPSFPVKVVDGRVLVGLAA